MEVNAGSEHASCDLTLPVQFLFVGVVSGPLKNRSPARFNNLFIIKMGGAAGGVGVALTVVMTMCTVGIYYWLSSWWGGGAGRVESSVRVFTSIQRRGGG